MSERYWIFQNNQVVGPFSIEELVSRPDFSGDALVCPEGRQGTDAGDWQRASLMSSISQAMSKPKSPVPSQLAPSQPDPSPEFSGDTLLIKELSLLGAVHEKLGALGQNVSQMQESVKDVKRELDEFRTKFDGDNGQAKEWDQRIKNLENISASFGGLKDSIEKIAVDSRAQGVSLEEATRSQKRWIEELSQKLESLSQSQNGVQPLEAKISDLNSRIQELAEKVEGASQVAPLSASLDELRGMVGGLKDEIAELRLKQESFASAPVSAVPPPAFADLALSSTASVLAPAITPLEQPLESASLEGSAAGNVGFPPSPFAPPASMPEMPQIAPMGESTSQIPGAEAVPDFILPIGNIPDPNLAASPVAPMETNQTPGLGDSLIDPGASAGAEIPLGVQAVSAPPDSSSLGGFPSESTEAPVKAQKKSRKGVWVLIFALAGGVLFALAYVLGLIPGLELSKPKSVALSLPLASSAASSLSMPNQSPVAAQASASSPTPAPLPPDQDQSFKDSAIKLVQNWPISLGGKTISEALGATASGPLGDLSPWSAEKIKDNLYQVNYQTPPAMNGTQKSYEFQADLSLQKVVGQNQAALDLLSGKSQVPLVKRKLAKKRPLAKKKILARRKKKVALKKKVVAKKKSVAKKSPVKKMKKGDIMPGIPNPQSATGNSSPLPAPSSSPAAQPQAAPTSGQNQNQELDQLLKP